MPSEAQTTQSNFCSCTSGGYNLTCVIRQHSKMARAISDRQLAESQQVVAKEKQRIYDVAHQTS